MLDDTCYFLSFDDATFALITLALLNSPQSLNFLKSVAFMDSKRPYTKDVLQRLVIIRLLQIVDKNYIFEFTSSLTAGNSLTETDIERYRDHLSKLNQALKDWFLYAPPLPYEQ